MIIPQIERYAYLISFDQLLTSHFKEALSFLTSKSKNLTGNDYVLICNSLLWNQIGDNLMNEIGRWTPTATLMYSKSSGMKKMHDNWQYVYATAITKLVKLSRRMIKSIGKFPNNKNC